jgi:hypothetical protein
MSERNGFLDGARNTAKTIHHAGKPHRSIGKAFYGVGSLTARTAGLLQKAVRRSGEDTAFIEAHPDENERFEVRIQEGAANEGVSPEDFVRKLKRKTFLQAITWLLILAAVWWCAVMFDTSGGNFFTSWQFLAFVVTGPAFAWAMSGAFLNWQLRARRLAPFSVWAMDPRKWLPEL